MEDSTPPETSPAGGETSTGEDDLEDSTGGGSDDLVLDVSGRTWDVSLFQRPPRPPLDGSMEGLYVYQNTFHLIPRSIGRLGRLKTLKFFANEIEVLPPETGDLVELERLQVKVSSPGILGFSLKKLKSLKELELFKVPTRPSAFSILNEIANLSCLTKLSICHFSIRYFPPEIGCLKKLEELDLSFNKLKKLPNDIVELNALKLLRVANNKLEDLPSEICSLRRLENLDLSNNRLTSLASLKLASMHNLQYLNLQYNKLLYYCQVPPWICCNFEGNEEATLKDVRGTSLLEENKSDVAANRSHGNSLCNGYHHTPSCSHPGTSLSCRSATQRMRKGWKRRDRQQMARQERLNYSRKWRGEDHRDTMAVKMAEEDDTCKTMTESIQSELHLEAVEEKLLDSSGNSGFPADDMSGTVEGSGIIVDHESPLVSDRYTHDEKNSANRISYENDDPCIIDSMTSNKDYVYENEGANNDYLVSPLNELNVPDENSSGESGSHYMVSCFHPDNSLSCKCSASQRMRKGWKHCDWQQRARQERLNYSRNWRPEVDNANMIVKMVEANDLCKLTVMENSQSELQVDAGNLPDSSAKPGGVVDDILGTVEDDINGVDGDTPLVSRNCGYKEKSLVNNISYGEEDSCLTDSMNLNKDYDHDSEDVSSNLLICPSNEIKVSADNASSRTSKMLQKPKRPCEKDLDDPKPSKRRSLDDCSFLSCKYSTESFCSVDDHLPDGFYDAGRDRPFMSLQEYEQSLCLDSREVILLDRGRDEELDAIASSAKILLSRLKRSVSSEEKMNVVDNLQRASILALFVSDCFGGSERSSSVMRMRKAMFGANKQQPFICTCSARNIYDNDETSNQAYGTVEDLDFTELCENSLRLIKKRRKSNVVPIGILRFGVCRHRAVLMKYLCDRADPPIPCELVRGYLDFMPHAWNAILVRRDSLWVRMVVDTCYPTDIREETDPEYFCRYIPLGRSHVPLTSENDALVGCSFPSLLLYLETEKTQSHSVFHCKFGTLDAAVKMRHLEAKRASHEQMQNFEYAFLGEVRMLGALRKHSCIVEIYGHQLSSKWLPPADGDGENRLLQSIIVMEYIKGGSLKKYLEKLSKLGEKHAPLDVALFVAKDVACALVELHSKNIIHRDIKSENILVDLECKRSDGTPIVKLCDFDRAVPLQSSMHTNCCIAHLGIHPPEFCVGTPRWMAPEVVQTRHRRTRYGLEVDIWSYGCLLLELLTLQIPFKGKSEDDIFHLLQMEQRPRLTPELEALASSIDEAKAGTEQVLPSDTRAAESLKLLVDIFFHCTKADPADRPKAKHIYERLCAFSRQLEATPKSISSSS